jgi:hypothetical protein
MLLGASIFEVVYGHKGKGRFFRHDLGSGIGIILLLENTWCKTRLLMSRGTPFCRSRPKAQKAAESGVEVVLAIRRDLRKSRRMVGALGQLGGLLGGKKKKP